jgi:hypothetical protein
MKHIHARSDARRALDHLFSICPRAHRADRPRQVPRRLLPPALLPRPLPCPESSIGTSAPTTSRLPLHSIIGALHMPPPLLQPRRFPSPDHCRTLSNRQLLHPNRYKRTTAASRKCNPYGGNQRVRSYGLTVEAIIPILWAEVFVV